MFNPPHPGKILNEGYFKPLGLSVTQTAKKLRVTRPTLSAILNGRAGISPEMAVRLSRAFPKQSAQFWIDLQSQYDLAKAMRKKVYSSIKPIAK